MDAMKEKAPSTHDSCSIMCVSNFSEDGTPPVVLGDFSIHLNKPQATDFLALLGSFDLTRRNHYSANSQTFSSPVSVSLTIILSHHV